MKKTISIVTPTFNEVQNIEKLCFEISEIMDKSDFNYEHIVIDNNSSDGTIEKLRNISKKNKNLKVIINTKNFGHIRSPFHGIMQSNGDATILINSDFQEPLDLIPKYIEKWKSGSSIVLGKRSGSDINFFSNLFKKLSYKMMNNFSEIKLSNHTSGTGIFDKKIIECLKKIDDPYPFFRGLIFEITSNIDYVEFHQNKRLKGKSKTNFYTLYDYAALALVKHSKLPLRYLTFLGFIFSILSLLTSIFFLFYKLIFWNSFELGIAPIIIGLFFLISIQLFFLGFIGEYLMQILSHQRKIPLVIEKERINF